MKGIIKGLIGVTILAGYSLAGAHIDATTVQSIKLYDCNPERAVNAGKVLVSSDVAICKARVVYVGVSQEGGIAYIAPAKIVIKQ
jgi:hypothetical protein